MSGWKKFGESPEKQSSVVRIKDTYGGASGKVCNQCEVMMNSEIEIAQCENYVDEQTKSDAAYCSSQGADGYIDAEIRISW